MSSNFYLCGAWTDGIKNHVFIVNIFYYGELPQEVAKGSKLTVGKQFYKEVTKLEDIEFLRKSPANLAIYRKK